MDIFNKSEIRNQIKRENPFPFSFNPQLRGYNLKESPRKGYTYNGQSITIYTWEGIYDLIYDLNQNMGYILEGNQPNIDNLKALNYLQKALLNFDNYAIEILPSSY